MDGLLTKSGRSRGKVDGLLTKSGPSLTNLTSYGPYGMASSLTGLKQFCLYCYSESVRMSLTINELILKLKMPKRININIMFNAT